MKSVLTTERGSVAGPALDSICACPVFFFRWEVGGLQGPQDLFFFSHHPPPAKDPETRVTCLCTRHCASSFDILVNLCSGCCGNPTVKQLPLCRWDLDLAVASLTTSQLAWHTARGAGSQHGGLCPEPRCSNSPSPVSLSVQWDKYSPPNPT